MHLNANLSHQHLTNAYTVLRLVPGSSPMNNHVESAIQRRLGTRVPTHMHRSTTLRHQQPSYAPSKAFLAAGTPPSEDFNAARIFSAEVPDNLAFSDMSLNCLPM